MSAPVRDSVWRSGDKRDHGRTIRVVQVSYSGEFVYVVNVTTRRASRIHISRFDGKQWIPEAAS